MTPLALIQFAVAWNGGGGQLWTLGADNVGRYSGYNIVGGSSPAVAG